MRQGHLDSRSRWPASSLRPTGGLIQLNRLTTVAVVRLPPLSSTSFHGGSSWSPGGWPLPLSTVSSLLWPIARAHRMWPTERDQVLAKDRRLDRPARLASLLSTVS